MPITYHCDNCEITAESLVGWKIISVVFIAENPFLGPPGGRTQEAVAPDFIFHDEDCRTAWCEKTGVPPLSALVPPA